MAEEECLTCKKHYSQGGKCWENKRNCLFYEVEPRGKMVRTNITFGIDVSAETPVLKYNSHIAFEEDGETIEMVCIKINWVNLKTRRCNIDAEYHENEKPRFEKRKMFKIIIQNEDLEEEQ